MIHQDEIHLLAHVLRDVGEVGLVALGQNHRLDAHPVGGQHLFFDAAHRQHLAPQGYLTRHRHVGADGLVQKQRCQSHHHRNPCRWTVLGDGPGGDVQVDVVFLEEVAVNAQFLGFGADVAEGGLGRFLHHVAQLPGEDEPLLAGHLGGFHEEHIAAGGSPGQARRHTGDFGALHHFGVVLGLAQVILQVIHIHVEGAFLALGHFGGHLAADGSELPLQVADPGLTGVLPDYLADGLVGDGELVLAEAVLPELPGQQVFFGDMELFFLGVTGKLDDFHPVPQGGRDGIQHVGSGDEHHLRQVEGHVQVVVPELPVLLRVQHLQQGRRRVTPEVGADFVHLVQHKDGVLGAHPADGLDDAARHSAHVGAPVPPDFGFVPDAAQADADELAPQGPGDGLAQGGLARPRRPHEAQDYAFTFTADVVGELFLLFLPLFLAVFLELADGQVFQDALFDFLQVVVVFIQDAPCPFDVQVVFGGHVPG